MPHPSACADLCTSSRPANTRSPPERPRERLWRHGPEVLTDVELLAVVLGTGLPGQGVMALARQLLADSGLRGLLGRSPQALAGLPGLGPAKACQLGAILELARRSLAEELRRGEPMNQAELSRRYCASLLAHRDVEICLALYLDNQLRLIQYEELSRGTLSQAALYPREVVRAALRHHAAAVILAHNHPSGRAEPSAADRRITRHVREALALIDIRLLDHIIVAGNQTVSLAAEGLIDAGA
ncbi:JAB domain-containing protein [Verticiella sediminum]|uniref:JAB domain-containing protein n=1 Tax=Verticiella sediminum TaxID=1247510 RepID=A0A556A904_9BURK|nr:DNA repair protein RadC [Verticiella sediminum]TSH89368.1 JAB domain-containing protein [Verticiella sediminum]